MIASPQVWGTAMWRRDVIWSLTPVACALILAASTFPATAAAQTKRPAAITPKPPAEPARPQSLPEQLLAAARVDAHQMAADRFADPTPLPEGVVGQPFRLEYAFSAGDVVRSSYGDGSLKLSLDIKGGGLSGVDDGEIRALVTGRRHKALGSYQASNAFGATIHVSKSQSQTDVLALVRHPHQDVGRYDDPYVAEVALTGAQAKTLIANASAVIDGRIHQTANGNVSGCHISSTTPTISLPIDDEDEICWVAVKIDRVAFIDKSTGAVIREWTKAPDRAATIEPIPPASLRGYYPMELMMKRRRIAGVVTLSCAVRKDGWVKNCEVVKEEPAGLGFGKEALSAMSLKRGEPAITDGEVVDGKAETTLTITPPN